MTLSSSPALRLALREMRGGIKGFRVFVICLARGVGATGILVQTGYGTTQAKRLDRPRDAIVTADLMAATVRILELGTSE